MIDSSITLMEWDGVELLVALQGGARAVFWTVLTTRLT
jgi:hypothetical protein